jgi:hypothetical protein
MKAEEPDLVGVFHTEKEKHVYSDNIDDNDKNDNGSNEIDAKGFYVTPQKEVRSLHIYVCIYMHICI